MRGPLADLSSSAVTLSAGVKSAVPATATTTTVPSIPSAASPSVTEVPLAAGPGDHWQGSYSDRDTDSDSGSDSSSDEVSPVALPPLTAPVNPRGILNGSISGGEGVDLLRNAVELRAAYLFLVKRFAGMLVVFRGCPTTSCNAYVT